MEDLEKAKIRIEQTLLESDGDIKVLSSDNGSISLEVSNGRNFRLSEDEIKYQANEYDIEQRYDIEQKKKECENQKMHKQFNLEKSCVELLIKSLEARRKEAQKEWCLLEPLANVYVEEPFENQKEKKPLYRNIDDRLEALRNEDFDIMGLIAMLKESDAVGCIIPKTALDKGWSFEHNVDIPTPYSGDFIGNEKGRTQGEVGIDVTFIKTE